jgi:hypothetical protein
MSSTVAPGFGAMSARTARWTPQGGYVLIGEGYLHAKDASAR